MRIALTGPLATAPLVHHLDPDQRGGMPSGLGGQPVAALAQTLLERGVELVVITLDPSVEQEIVASGPVLRLRIGPYRRQRRARDAFRLEREYVASALQRERPDVVHAHWTYEFALGSLASGYPTLTTIHDWGPAILRFHPDPYRAVRLMMQAQTLWKGRYFTAVSPYIQQRVSRWAHRSPIVVPNGLLDDTFERAPRSLDANAPILVAVNAGFGRRKNVTTLLRALALVRRKHPATRLLLIGAGYGSNGPAHQWALARGLEGGALFTGQVEAKNVAMLLQQAHVLVHPSLEESFGLVLLEAMAQGLPVVAGEDSGAVPWVLDGGRAGLLTDVRSPARLAAAIESVITDPRRWQSLSETGFEHSWSCFRHSRVTDRYLQLYQTVHNTSKPVA